MTTFTFARCQKLDTGQGFAHNGLGKTFRTALNVEPLQPSFGAAAD